MSNASELKDIYPSLHGGKQDAARRDAALLLSVRWDLVHTLLADDCGSATTARASA
jgi:hypothetical protein